MPSGERHLIEYQVCHADWAHVESGADHSGWKEMEPSDTMIDDRTIRVKVFATESDAQTYAKEFLSRRDDRWLAYLEIKKCEIEVIRKLK